MRSGSFVESSVGGSAQDVAVFTVMPAIASTGGSIV